jgi:glycerol-3-phosphate dehydrogenase
LVGAESKDPKELGLTTVEGIHATELAAALAKRLGVETPLLDSVTNCLQAKNCFAQPFEMFLKEVKI